MTKKDIPRVLEALKEIAVGLRDNVKQHPVVLSTVMPQLTQRTRLEEKEIKFALKKLVDSGEIRLHMLKNVGTEILFSNENRWDIVRAFNAKQKQCPDHVPSPFASDVVTSSGRTFKLQECEFWSHTSVQDSAEIARMTRPYKTTEEWKREKSASACEPRSGC